MIRIAALWMAFGLAGVEAGRGEVYSVVELSFTGPSLGTSSTPAKDVDFWVRFRHESGSPEYKIHGYWDGDGAGGASGNVFKVRFCPTKTGRWDLLEVYSNRAELLNEKEGDFVTATASTRKGFWIKDSSSPGQRWYKRSDGSHAYIFGNTHYSFLSERHDTGATGSTIAADVNANAAYFNKLRFSIHGDRYPHPTERPFLDNAGAGTENGDYSHRPNPVWWHRRVDTAVKTAFGKDLIADLILAGPDSVNARATLRASANGGDNKPYLKYIAARYGSYPNVWLCFCNEYDIKTPLYSNAQVIAAGQALRGFLPYPVPLSIHAAPNDWDSGLNSSPAWHDHYILQSKIKDLSDASDNMSANHPRAGGNAPGINDELGYQGAGDGFTEGDILEGHLGAFLGGGYGSTGEKYGSKLGQYFWGDFDAAVHTAADNLLWLRQRIDANVAFWNLAPTSVASSIFGNTDAGYRVLQESGNEIVLGTDVARAGVTATLPAGTWQVKGFDVIAKSETLLSSTASGTYVFNAPASRANFFHFKKTGSGGGGGGATLDVPCEADTYVYQSFPATNYGTAAEIAVGGGTTTRAAFLRFNVSGLPAGATVTEARLILVCNGNSTATGGTIRRYAPAVAQWSETQPTWNSPLAGADASGDLSSLGPVSAGGTYAFTNLGVTGNGRVTFVIRSTAQDGAQYRSREFATASQRPILRLTHTGASSGFTVTIDQVSTGKAYAVSTAQLGAVYYIDRSYTITSLSAALNGGKLIRAANDDKNVTTANHLTFTASGPATVYVGYDKRATTLPSWLSDGTWPAVGETLAVTDAGASPMRVYARSIPAGPLTLGGNGGAGALTHYVVVVKAASSPAASFAAATPDTWTHEGDADGDGLSDAFEIAQPTDPMSADTDGDGLPDEAELGADGKTLWEAQEAGSTPVVPTGGPGGGACGATGLELLLLLAWRRLSATRGRRAAVRPPERRS